MLIFGVISSSHHIMRYSKISEYGDYLFSNPITLDTTELHFIVGTLTEIIPLQQLQTAYNMKVEQKFPYVQTQTFLHH